MSSVQENYEKNYDNSAAMEVDENSIVPDSNQALYDQLVFNGFLKCRLTMLKGKNIVKIISIQSQLLNSICMFSGSLEKFSFLVAAIDVTDETLLDDVEELTS